MANCIVMMSKVNWWCFSVVLFVLLKKETNGASYCNNYRECAYYNLYITDSTGDLHCDGYASCVGARITINSDGDRRIYCDGTASCYNTTIIVANSIGNDYIYCEGPYSCAYARMQSSNNNDNSVNISSVDCYGERSCFNAEMTAVDTRCWGVSSCSLSTVSILSEANCYGFGSCVSANWECIQSNGGCIIEMQGAMASEYTNIVCNDGDCTFECYLNGCYGLSVSGSSNIYRQCSNTWYSTLANDFCDGYGSTRDGIEYILNSHSILWFDNEYNIPNLVNNINLFKSGTSDDVLDSTYYNYDNFYNDNYDCSYAEYGGSNYAQYYSNTLTIHNNNNNYNGICCYAQQSCQSVNFVLFSNYSNYYNFIQCEGVWSCLYTQFNFLESNIMNANMTMNIHGDGYESASYMTLDNTINDHKINVFSDGSYAFLYATMENVENVYCLGAWTCRSTTIKNGKNVFGYGYASVYDSSIVHVKENIYCLSQAACQQATIMDVGKHVYLFSSAAGSASNITNVQGSVIAYGYNALYYANVECIDSYVFCIGYYACYGTTIKSVSQGIIAYGDDSLVSADIETSSNSNGCGSSDYFSKNDYGTITIDINGTMNYYSTITCTGGDTCAIYCRSSNACTNIYLYCYSNCIVYCDETEGIDCPINGNSDKWLTPTTSPTEEPSNEPSPMPSDFPSQTPTAPTAAPVKTPSKMPTLLPSRIPSFAPTEAPSHSPQIAPTGSPSQPPTEAPSDSPQVAPTGSPSQPPTEAPSLSPSMTPSEAPSSAPTADYCDDTIQSGDTYDVCTFFASLDSDQLPTFLNDNENDEVRSYDYCQSFSDYFECNGERITKLLFGNSGIGGELKTTIMEILPKTLIEIDFSNNNFDGVIGWSWLEQFENLTTLKFSNNSFSTQTVDFDEFKYVSQLSTLDLSDNDFEGTIKFEFLVNLRYLNLANNGFTEISDFENVNQLSNLKEMYIENNEINEKMDLSWFPRNGNFEILHCYNNELHGSSIVLNNLPNSTVEFVCGSNDFGRLTWTVDSDSYELEYLDLSNCNIEGDLSMNVFDSDGAFGDLKKVFLNENSKLNISINFEYLGGSSIEMFNILGVTTCNDVDFSGLTSYIVIKMGTSTKCVSSVCTNDDEPISVARNNNTCVGATQCLDTCECDTRYGAGLETYSDDGKGDKAAYIFGGVIGVLAICGAIAFINARKSWLSKVPCVTRRDDFDHVACFGYLFQVWDIFSDGLLAYDMLDHFMYYRDAGDDSQARYYGIFFGLCVGFIALPLIVNMAFFWQTQKKWKAINRMASSKNINKDGYALYQSKVSVAKWLSGYNSTLLIVLCFFSGGVVASIKMVNCKLFGWNAFNMGLPKHEQEEIARHKLWLTIILENIPQITVNLLYWIIMLDAEDDNITVILALVSSVLSVCLTVFSMCVQYPKHFWIYEMTCKLSDTKDDKLTTKLKQTKKLGKTICEAIQKDENFLYVENVCVDNSNIIMNVVCATKLITNESDHDNICEKLKEKHDISKLTSVEMEDIHHKCITFSEYYNNILCCNKNGGGGGSDIGEDAEMVASSVNNHRRYNVKSETGSAVASSVAPSAAALSPRSNSVNHHGTEDVDIIMAASTEGVQGGELAGSSSQGPIGTGAGVDTDSIGGNCEKWTCAQVCQWFEARLLNGDDFKDNSKEIEDFIKLLKKQGINGQSISRMVNKDDAFSKKMKETLSSQCDCFGIWILFETEIEEKWKVTE